MPLGNPSLTNCYTPSLKLPIPKNEFNDPSKRPFGDGTSETRSSKSIRRLYLDRSVLSSSSGSSLVELGHTKVLCSVHGPRPSTSSSLSTGGGKEFHSSGVLNCELRFAPTFGIRPETTVITTPTNLDGFSSSAGSGGGTSAQEIELSSRLHDAISPSIPLELLMKSVVDVFVMVLQDDGSVFAASVIAASMALADAGIEIYDLVSACSVAIVPRGVETKEKKVDDGDSIRNVDGKKTGFNLLVDPVENELLDSKGVVTLAMMPNWKEVTFWDQTGLLPPHISSDAAELCRDGCNTMNKFMKQSLTGNLNQS
mmetsp:Transcript_19681/g.24271  ORF Transcript_19681/g.24271 Transcript_19681/m.24271 type:complete len:312 (+) Transcript_19681:226-1161(+)